MPETHERNYLVGILAENHKLSEMVCGAFGKAGQKTDLQFYDRLDAQLNCVFCAIDAIAYPDRVKSLIYTMMLTQYHVLLVDVEKGITPAIGEIIVTMDIFAREFGTDPFVAIGNIDEKTEYLVEETTNKLKKLLSATSLKSASIIILKDKEDREKIKKEIYDLGQNKPFPTMDKSKTIVDIDHVFPVHGIGTVILGLVRTGQVTAGEMLNLMGTNSYNKKVIVRSIQKQDRDFKTAEGGDRVGLAIKGITVEEVNPGFILAASDLYTISGKFKVKAKISPFYKEILSPDSPRQFHLFIGLTTSPFKVVSGDTIQPGKEGMIELELEKPMPVPVGHPKGIIAELNKFDNKLRIVGHFQIG